MNNNIEEAAEKEYIHYVKTKDGVYVGASVNLPLFIQANSLEDLKRMSNELFRSYLKILNNSELVFEKKNRLPSEETKVYFQTPILKEAEQLKQKINDYKNLLRFMDVPEVIIENPKFIKGGKPTEKDIEWAIKEIEKFKSDKNSKTITQYAYEQQKIPKDIIQRINNYWRFDDNQRPLSSWHEKQDLIEELNREWQSQNSEAVELLKELCDLKKYKDEVGKTARYLKDQPLAWEKANKFLDSIK